jgi:hypothetical protein
MQKDTYSETRICMNLWARQGAEGGGRVSCGGGNREYLLWLLIVLRATQCLWHVILSVTAAPAAAAWTLFVPSFGFVQCCNTMSNPAAKTEGLQGHTPEPM